MHTANGTISHDIGKDFGILFPFTLDLLLIHSRKTEPFSSYWDVAIQNDLKAP